MTNHALGYRPDIDGLRTIAVLAVIFYHAGLPIFSGGYVGVDIFFVISGYLITGIIAREMGDGPFSFGGFYERRIRRILPALFFVSTFSTVVGWLLLSPGQLQDFGQSLVATMGFAANIYFYLKSGYFSPDVHTLPMIHMWSLAVEEQYYLAFPLVLLIFTRFLPRWRSLLVLVSLLLSLAISIKVQQSWPTANFYLTPLRAWELLAGSLLALEHTRISTWLGRTPRLATMLGWIGLLLLASPMFLFNDRTAFPGVTALVPVAGTMAVLVTAGPGGMLHRLLANRLMVGIGLISYSAYLWHQPLFAFALLWNGQNLGPLAKAGLIGLTLLMAYASWRWVEQPFRSRDRFSRTQMFAFAAFGSVAFVTIGLLLHFQRGMPERFGHQQLELAATMEPSKERNRCHTEGIRYRRFDAACRYSGKRQDWAIFGDSHAIELGMALAERLEPADRGVVHLTFSGCPPAYRFLSDNPGCTAWTRDMVAAIASSRDIRHVLIAYRHNFYLWGDQTQSYPRVPDQRPRFLRDLVPSAARTAYWQSFKAQIQALTSSGKVVYVVAPIPDLPVHVERLVFTRSGNTVAPDIAREWHQRRSAEATAAMRALAALPGVIVIDPAPALCDAEGCAWRSGNEVLYFDDNHLSMAGARRVIDMAVATGQIEIERKP